MKRTFVSCMVISFAEYEVITASSVEGGTPAGGLKGEQCGDRSCKNVTFSTALNNDAYINMCCSHFMFIGQQILRK